MQTKITKRGQTVVPASIRKRYDMEEGGILVWLDDGETIKVVPIPADPIGALRGCGEGENLYQALLDARKEERDHE